MLCQKIYWNTQLEVYGVDWNLNEKQLVGSERELRPRRDLLSGLGPHGEGLGRHARRAFLSLSIQLFLICSYFLAIIVSLYTLNK